MSEFETIYPDGNIAGYESGLRYFAGHSFRKLVTQTLTDFAKIQIDENISTPIDHRLIDAFNRNKLTDGVVKRYIEIRQIYNIVLILTPECISAEIEFAKLNPNP